MKNEETKKLYKVVLSNKWGKNSGATVKWDANSLNHCLDAEKFKGEWISSYEESL